LIQKKTLLYNVCYRRVLKSAKPSGTTEDDIRDKACDEYLDSYGKPFLFKHCLDYLWTAPKFDPMVAEEDTKEVVQLDDDDDDDDDQPIEVTKRLEGVNRTLDAMGAAMNQLVGAKAAKAQLKDERSSYLTETANSKGVAMEKISNTQDKIADTLAAKNMFLSAKNWFHEMKSLRDNYQFCREIRDAVAAGEECLKALAEL
jgi:hypothetical protein